VHHVKIILEEREPAYNRIAGGCSEIAPAKIVSVGSIDVMLEENRLGWRVIFSSKKSFRGRINGLNRLMSVSPLQRSRPIELVDGLIASVRLVRLANCVDRCGSRERGHLKPMAGHRSRSRVNPHCRVIRTNHSQ